MSRLGLSVVAVFALGCNGVDPIVDDWGVAGYAVIMGTVTRASGEPFYGEIFISCGIDQPGFFGGSTVTSEAGRYRSEVKFPGAEHASLLDANEWRGICEVSAPADAPRFASARDTILWAPTLDAQIENTITVQEQP